MTMKQVFVLLQLIKVKLDAAVQELKKLESGNGYYLTKFIEEIGEKMYSLSWN